MVVLGTLHQKNFPVFHPEAATLVVLFPDSKVEARSEVKVQQREREVGDVPQHEGSNHGLGFQKRGCGVCPIQAIPVISTH
jgi:hypothetical protein